ncbi:MAG TPA: amidohydrolase family protein [Caulobacteraceae bacterium]|jgi:predicted TIM-barrel fold metal-dependent hydrolase|nr:amidohydrolase family protein [Caulobacteraceae bacterium]
MKQIARLDRREGFSRRACLAGAAAGGLALMAHPALALPVRAGRAAAPLVDHHIHLGSPTLSDRIAQIDKADPSAFDHLSRDIFSRPTLSDALHLLDEAGIQRAVLLSSAYLFMPGSTFSDATAADAAGRQMREENRFAVEAGRASHGRLIVCFAVNPFAPNANEEFAYWKSNPGVHGLKLHLGSADFHASNPEQVLKVAALFAAAREARLAPVVHLRGGGPFPKAEVEVFIDKVVSQAGDLPVQIAHGGGYGGADPATIDSLATFGAAIAQGAPGTKNLVLDLSGIVLPDADAQALGSTDAQLKVFVALMRKIGLDRFVMGSDWPAIGRIAPYYDLMRRRLPVTDDEWARLCSNVAPYLRKPRSA